MSNMFCVIFFTILKLIIFQNGRTSTCSGDSGGPLVKETLSATNDYFFKLVGVLHGSKNSNCAIRRPTSHPSMFSNLEHQKNFDFISQWKDSYNDFINAVTDQNSFTQIVNYTTNFNIVDESGQNGLEEDAYTDMLIKICKKVRSSWKALRNYGANCTDLPNLLKKQCLRHGGSNQQSCTHYNKMVVNQCAGQHSYGQVGLGRFGINCSCKFLRTYFKFILNNNK